MTLLEFLIWEACGHLWKIAERGSMEGFASKEEYYEDLKNRMNKELGEDKWQEKTPEPKEPEKPYKVHRKGKSARARK